VVGATPTGLVGRIEDEMGVPFGQRLDLSRLGGIVIGVVFWLVLPLVFGALVAAGLWALL
jgi:hypothetical protein